MAHVGKDKIRATYNNAQYTEKRRKMMQWWSDYLDYVGINGYKAPYDFDRTSNW